MKKILLLCIITFTMHITFAQQRPPKERIKALKTAYITEQLNLSSKEAQQFWPIYNEHEDTMQSLKKNEQKSIKAAKQVNGFENLSKKEAEGFLGNYLLTEEKKFLARKKRITDLKQVITPKKILRLIKAEKDFNKRLLKQLRRRRQPRQ